MNTTRYIEAMFAQTACIWEATARKPGNVHRYRDFEDTSYLDFLTSAAAIAPVLAVAHQLSVGETIFNCVCMTGPETRTNTNLGIILLLTPLLKATDVMHYQADVERILRELTVDDARWTYTAIRMRNPGGLGAVQTQDVRAEPTVTLREAMALAADRDLVARQYANGFQEVFDEGAPALERGIEHTRCIEGGIIYAYLYLMSRFPDSLIARKCGIDTARESVTRAQRVLDLGWPHTGDGRREIVELDRWLCADGHRRNPGTTADLIAASLYVQLRQGRFGRAKDIPWPLAQGAP